MSRRPPLTEELVVLSDLHVGAWAPEVTADDEAALGRALAHHLGDRLAPEPRLVLLGDAFDFAAARPKGETSVAASVATLDRLAATHPAVFGALATWLDGGGRLDLVVGNHDLDLARPPVQRRLVELVGGTAVAERVRVHPWVFHLPGVLHAEHGHQHHDVNALATPAMPWRPGREDCLERPLAAALGGGRARLLAAAARHSASLVGPARAARRAAYRRDVLPALAGDAAGLDACTLVALDRLSRPTPWGMAARLAGVATRPPGPPTQRGGYLHRGARRVHDVLAARGRAVPFYLFGHTHVPEQLPLVAGAPGGPSYLNAGTWSPAVPAGLPDRLHTFVQVFVPRQGSPVAGVWRWDDERGRSAPYPAA